MNLRKKIKKNQSVESLNSNLYFEQQDQTLSKAASERVKQQKLQSSVKTQESKSNKKGSKGPSRQRIKTDSTLKFQFSEEQVRQKFLQQALELKHGKWLSLQQMIQYKNKMQKDNYNSNPYRYLNYNTGQENQWRDNMKKALTQEDIKQYKQQFLNIMKMVDRGQHAKYTIRDLGKEFNLDESAVLQLRRQFQIDPDVSIYLNKRPTSIAASIKQTNQIQHRQKKTILLKHMIDTNPFLTKPQLADKIAISCKNKDFFPQSQIQRLVQQEGFTWRKKVKYPQSRNFKQNLFWKKQFCQRINYILTQTNYKVYFLGLMDFNSFMFRQQGWTKDEYLLPPIINESITLVGLCERAGEGTWKFQKQVYKEQNFLQTVRTLFDILLPQKFQPKYVVVDFSLYKYRDALKKSRKKYDVEIIWTPPFSNLLNPLEFWFQQIGGLLSKSKKILELSQQCNLVNQINRVLIKDIFAELVKIFKEQYNKEFDFTKYFLQAAKYHEKALKMQKF